jgi:hypothetical protein
MGRNFANSRIRIVTASPESVHGQPTVTTEINLRPRKRLGFRKPIEQIGPLLLR